MMTPAAPMSATPASPTQSGGWFVQFARLVGWELFLAWRRRAMMITLASLLIIGYLLVVLVQYAIYYSYASDASSGRFFSNSLGFPGSISIGGSYIANAGVLLFVVLAGALIGSEYSYSTLRLSLSRGVGRGQLLSAQIVALAILALILTALALAVSALTGLLGLALGVAQSPGALSGSFFSSIILYWLALAFNVFAYALISVWIGTLTRSVAGAIAGPLVFIVIEVVSTDILTALRDAPLTSPALNALGHIPDYLMGVNTSSLINWAGSGVFGVTAGQASVGVAHALIVSAVYVALFCIISYLALQHRDVVE